MTITDRDIRRQVASAVGANGSDLAAGIDIDGITAEIQAAYGLIDIETIDHDTFWAIVERHDAGTTG